MNLRRIVGRLLAALVIAGLVLAPLVTPAAAKRLPVGGMSDMAAMSAGMPCHMDGQKNNNCRDCPLIAMCMLTIAQAEPSLTNAIQISFEVRKLSFALENMDADGLVGVPPDHPPRILT
jgi:hypothetical protein